MVRAPPRIRCAVRGIGLDALLGRRHRLLVRIRAEAPAAHSGPQQGGEQGDRRAAQGGGPLADPWSWRPLADPWPWRRLLALRCPARTARPVAQLLDHS